MSDSRAVVEYLRGQFQQAHGWLEGTMEGVAKEVAQKRPGGKATNVGAQYGHIIASEDGMINGLLRGGASGHGHDPSGADRSERAASGRRKVGRLGARRPGRD